MSAFRYVGDFIEGGVFTVFHLVSRSNFCVCTFVPSICHAVLVVRFVFDCLGFFSF